MTVPDPSKFNEFLSAIGLGIGLVFSLLSLANPFRELALRIAGIAFIVCFAMFAENIWVFFAAVFITGTVVTSVGFLEKLAAIIRGSKEYFEHESKKVPPVQIADVEQKEEPQPSIASALVPIGGITKTAEPVVDTDNSISTSNAGSTTEEKLEGLMRKGDDVGIVSLANEIIQQKPNDPHWLMIRALAYAKQQKLDEAIADANAVLTQDPNNFEALKIRAECYRVQKRLDDAIRDSTLALSIRDDDAIVWNTRAASYTGLGRYDDAIRDFNRALQIDPKNEFSLVYRADVYRFLNRYQEALTDATTALGINPNYAYAYRVRAEVYRLLERYDDALRDVEEAIAREGETGFALATRAAIYFALKKFDESKQDAEKVKRLGTPNPLAEWVLKNLPKQ